MQGKYASRHDPLSPESHEPNPEPPSDDASIRFHAPDGQARIISPELLRTLPRTMVKNCHIISTGHGVSGPFAFGGVSLVDFIQSLMPENVSWSTAEVVSGDGFGTRVGASELYDLQPDRPILLADTIGPRPMTRQQGLVRLVVPDEQGDALRQVKWVSEIRLRP